MIDVIRAQLTAAEASVAACAVQLQAAQSNLAAATNLLTQMVAAQAQAAPTAPAQPTADGGVCDHPAPLRAPVPGRPGMWVCGGCGYNHTT